MVRSPVTPTSDFDGRARLVLLWANAAALCSAWLILLPAQFGRCGARFDADTLLLCVGYLAAVALGAMLPLAGGAALLPRRMRDVVVVGGTTALWMAAIVDGLLYRALGIHLDDPMVMQNVGNRHLDAELHLGWNTVISAGAAGAALAILQAAALRWFRGRLADRPTPRREALVFGAVAGFIPLAIGCFHLLEPARRHGNPALETLPLYRTVAAPVVLQEPLLVKSVEPGPAPRLQSRPHIVVVMVESLRHDMMTAALMPETWRWAEQANTVRSAQHVAGSHTTEFGVFSMLYGLPSLHYSPFLQSGTPSPALRLLRGNGYRLAAGAAAHLGEWNYAEFMFSEFDDYREFTSAHPDRDDAALADWADDLLARQPRDTPLFLFLFLNSTHHNYHYPPSFERHLPVLSPDTNYFLETARLSDARTEIFNRYRNSVGYVDTVITRVRDSVARHLGPDTCVVVTGDHGEEFWEHGLLGHSATKFVRERIQVPLVLHIPGVPARDVAVSSHADVLSTIAQHHAGSTALAPAWRGLGRDLLGPDPGSWRLVCGAGFPFGNPNACLVMPEHRVWLGKTGPALLALAPTVTTTATDERTPLTAELRARVQTHLAALDADLRTFLMPRDDAARARRSPPSHVETTGRAPQAVAR